MGTTSSNKLIVWAVDPFCEKCELVQQTARSVCVLAAEWDTEVVPVYLLSDFPTNVRLLPSLVREIQAHAQAELRHLLKGIKIPGLKPINIVGGTSSRLRDEVEQLLIYAKKVGASMIAIGTRARKGPQRWIMGSFAETLILKSDVPLFVINPNKTVPRRFKDILFPTDFSEESRAAFDQVVSFAKEMGVSITIFHKIKYDLLPAAQVALSTYSAYKEIYQDEVRKRQKNAEAWKSLASGRGVKTDFVIDYRAEGSTVQAILRRSKSRDGIIAMAAHSGPLASAILGSVTRQVVRGSTCPVWVIHTEQRKKGELPTTFTRRSAV